MSITHSLQLMNDAGLGQQDYFVYIITGLLGLALLFWGKSIFKVWLVGSGLTSGYALGSWLSALMDLSGVPHWLLVGFVAVAMAVLFGLAYKASFFLAGAALGLFLAWYTAALFNLELHGIVALVAMLVLGLIGVGVRDRFIMLASSVTGSLLLLDAVLGAIRGAEPFTILWQSIERWQLGESLVILLLALALTLLGYFTQSGKIRR